MESKKKKDIDLGISVKKDENFSEWYTQVLQKAELMEYTDVSGCYVIRPRAYSVWEKVQDFFNPIMKEAGVKNAYFPLFIPENYLTKEADHIEGFSPEVAWVTHAGNSKLNEKLAIRPTSETIMYPAYKKWIRSHRDLPLMINQWCNVVRWEFKNPVPFLRSREFLWQEGHNVFASEKEVVENAKLALEWYRMIFEDLYAIPVIKGQKSEKEKFAGASSTFSVETFLPSGKAIQGATSHVLGQNFAKAFDITFVDKDENLKHAWQNSWGITTRTIGIMVMMHGDDKGLVLPPRVAENKVVIIPILFDKSKSKVLKAASKIEKSLKKFSPILDDREEVTPGWKYSDWELKGIPIRIELGPKDIEKDQLVIVRRDNGKKEFVKIKDAEKKVDTLLEEMHNDLLENARKMISRNTVKASSMTEIKNAISDKKLVLIPWCTLESCEEEIKEKTDGAKTLNMPFGSKASGKCAACGKNAKSMVYVAKSY